MHFVVATIGLLVLGTSRMAGAFEPMLFMDLNDVVHPWGLVEEVANTVQANASFSPPPHLDFRGGALVIAVIESASDPGSFEVYAENTTGWEPLDASGGGVGGTHDCTLLRYTTADFNSYSAPHAALAISPCSGTPTMKSIARSPTGLYVMFTVGGPVENPP